jgi:hypothetical protein
VYSQGIKDRLLIGRWPNYTFTIEPFVGMSTALSKHMNSFPQFLCENAKIIPSNTSRLPLSKTVPMLLAVSDPIQFSIEYRQC